MRSIAIALIAVIASAQTRITPPRVMWPSHHVNELLTQTGPGAFTIKAIPVLDANGNHDLIVMWGIAQYEGIDYTYSDDGKTVTLTTKYAGQWMAQQATPSAAPVVEARATYWSWQ